MNFIIAHWKELLGASVLFLEQILPILPTKANSSAQLVINAVKMILPKKDV